MMKKNNFVLVLTMFLLLQLQSTNAMDLNYLHPLSLVVGTFNVIRNAPFMIWNNIKNQSFFRKQPLDYLRTPVSNLNYQMNFGEKEDGFQEEFNPFDFDRRPKGLFEWILDKFGSSTIRQGNRDRQEEFAEQDRQYQDMRNLIIEGFEDITTYFEETYAPLTQELAGVGEKVKDVKALCSEQSDERSKSIEEELNRIYESEKEKLEAAKRKVQECILVSNKKIFEQLNSIDNKTQDHVKREEERQVRFEVALNIKISDEVNACALYHESLQEKLINQSRATSLRFQKTKKRLNHFYSKEHNTTAILSSIDHALESLNNNSNKIGSLDAQIQNDLRSVEEIQEFVASKSNMGNYKKGISFNALKAGILANGYSTQPLLKIKYK